MAEDKKEEIPVLLQAEHENPASNQLLEEVSKALDVMLDSLTKQIATFISNRK